jgi:hypothetical protein
MKAVMTMIKAAMITGTTTARMERIVASTSSATLTGTLPAPPVVAVTAGRIAADFTTCTLPATRSPAMIPNAGWRPVTTSVLAAKRIAPAAGRMKVWMASLTWLTAGTLSAKNSTSPRRTSAPITHQLSRASQGELSWIQSVKRAASATISSGT